MNQAEKKFDAILQAIKSSGLNVDTKEINRAFLFAQNAHRGQKRLSGEEFITHPLEVTKILTTWKLDTDSIVAGMVHDTIEDTAVTSEEISKQFGENVLRLVAGVTKITKIRFTGSKEEIFAENLRKMILVMASDLRVVLIKLADRMHNMRTLAFLPAEKRAENARETMEIYAPLAERLGIGEVKGQLQDMAFPYVLPDEYKWLKQYSAPYYKTAHSHIKKVRRQVISSLAQSGITQPTIHARAKHYYSLYKKLMRPEIDRDIKKIYDLIALRIIVPTVEGCYVGLGVVHQKYHPVPYLGVRDFIANPKPNGYRSIHTNVFGPEGKIVEIQIRTHDMHNQAERGVAAHWQYSEVKNKGASDSQLDNGTTMNKNKLSWVKQLVQWQKEITDSKEYLKALKFDGLQHRNLVFSPKGDVFDLPYGATPIDFAYAVHSRMGHQVAGAKVNGKLVGLNHKLVNGDVVEIILNRHKAKPSSDWKKFAVTTKARRVISRALEDN